MKKIAVASTGQSTPELARIFRIAYLKSKTYDVYLNDGVWYKAMMDELLLGQEAGEFRNDITPEQVVDAFLYANDSLHMIWGVSDGKINVMEKAEKFVDNMIHMLK